MRKLAILTGAFALGVFLAQYLLPANGLLPGGAVCFLAACAAAVLPEPWRRRVLLAGVGLSLALGWTWLYVRQVQSPLEALTDTERPAVMTLCGYAVATDYGARAAVRLEGYPLGKVMYYGDASLLDLVPGQTVSDELFFQSAARIRDDDVTSFTSKGIFLLAYSRGDAAAGEGSAQSPRWWPVRLGQAMRRQIDVLFSGDTAGFLTAILTGDKQGLSQQAAADLSEAGLYHLLAVSGMHCMFLLSAVAGIAGRYRRRLVAAWAIPLLIFYALLTGGSPSVVRACVMAAFVLAAPLFRRDSDGPTALSAALALILLANPFAAASISLQLSFAAMAGMLWLPMRLYRLLAGKGKHGKLFHYTASSFSATMGALVFTVPLSAYYFGTLVLISPVSNLLCLWAGGGIFLLGLLTLGVSAVCLPLGALLGLAPRGLIAYLLAAAHLLAGLPGHALSLTNRYLLLWLPFAYLVFAAAWLGKPAGRRKYALAAALAAVMLVCTVQAWETRYDDGRLHLLALDVGQGESVLLRDGGGVALVDCGSGNSWYSPGAVAADYLRGMGCRSLDCLILTHYDADHVNGVADLLARVPVETLLAPDYWDDAGLREIVLSAAADHGVRVELVTEETRWSLGGSGLTVVPAAGGSGDNERGLAILCTRGDDDLLITGDMDAAAERRLLETWDLPDLEVLLAGHHGSKTSTSETLLEALTPETVIVSVGSNNYGHPARETLQRLRRSGADIYRTDLQGTIELTVN